jgi:anti-sigma B factor antagonist
MTTPFAFDARREDGACVVALRGEFDVATADLDRLAELVQQSDSSVVVDLDAVTFVDSTALGLLVGFQKLVNQRGLAFAIRRPTRRVEQLLAITGLDRVLGVETV